MAVIPQKDPSTINSIVSDRIKITKDWPSHPWFAAVTAVFGGLAGMFGSVFSAEIKSAFPFVVSGTEIIWSAASFWVFLGLFGYCFKLNISAQMEAQSKALAKLTANTERLEVLIRTLPDEGFILKFENYYEIVSDQVRLATLPGAEEEDIKDAIKGCLSALVHLARIFDGNIQIRYAVNIMTFEKLPTEPAELAELLKRIRFAERDADPRNWEGFLDLQCDFALVMDDNKQGDDHLTRLDDLVRPFAMPVPLEDRRVDKGRTTVLPGAIEAFCHPELVVALWQDTSELGEWCRNNAGLRTSLADDIEQYFATDPGNKIKSFASFPLGIPDSREPNGYKELLGVVNIHSNEINILGDAGTKLFAPLTTPFRIMLAELLKKLSSAA